MLESEFDMALGQMDYAERLTIEPGKRIGKPCIRVLRMAVYDVLDYLASGIPYRS